MELRKEVQWFAEQMEEKLRQNDYKGGWDKCSMQYLTMRLTQERKELNKLLKKKNKSSEDITKECVDIANFAMMIADNLKTGKY